MNDIIKQYSEYYNRITETERLFVVEYLSFYQIMTIRFWPELYYNAFYHQKFEKKSLVDVTIIETIMESLNIKALDSQQFEKLKIKLRKMTE